MRGRVRRTTGYPRPKQYEDGAQDPQAHHRATITQFARARPAGTVAVDAQRRGREWAVFRARMLSTAWSRRSRLSEPMPTASMMACRMTSWR